MLLLLFACAPDDPSKESSPIEESTPVVDSSSDSQPVDTTCDLEWFADTDNDGYGDPNNGTSACEQPDGYQSNGLDCDDTDASIHPTAPEIPRDNIDQDCDGDDECEDIDCDGLLDIVVSIQSCDAGYACSSLVFWGDGYVDAIALPTTGAAGNTIADLNNDGWAEVVFANHTDGSTWALDSTIYWGASANPFADTSGLPTVGAWGVTAGDLNADGWPELVFANHTDGSTYALESFIYWGSATGYSATDLSALPTVGAAGVSAADLNADGWPDLVFSNQTDGTSWCIDSYVYWGSATGFDASARTDLPTCGASGNAVADLNRDGWLDVVFASAFDGSTHSIDSTIYWGGAGGFTSSTALPTEGAVGVSLTDVDQDSYADVVISGGVTDEGGEAPSYVFWGSVSNYSDGDHIELATYNTAGNSVADLDFDGWKDLVYAGNEGVHIYWGPSWPYQEPQVLTAAGAALGLSAIVGEQGL